jgi:cell fate (sporulation/competence/biofilm development) regulator YlbF (YheA/YmcA/DUF963 family)
MDKIRKLWMEMRGVITQVYMEGKELNNPELDALRDYAEDISMHDDLNALMQREVVLERQHRRGLEGRTTFTLEDAARLLIMNQVVCGTNLESMPPATIFLTMKQTAAEAQTIGYLIRNKLSNEWRNEVNQLDYGELITRRVA